MFNIHHFMFACFKGFMVDVKAWAGCMSQLTQLVCTRATYKYSLLLEGWAW
jgi:hypothetical protein